MNDREREERAIWKLGQAGYSAHREAGHYVVTGPERLDELDDLTSLVEYADAVYERVWIRRKITPSA